MTLLCCHRESTLVWFMLLLNTADGWPNVVELFSVVGANPSPNQGTSYAWLCMTGQ